MSSTPVETVSGRRIKLAPEHNWPSNSEANRTDNSYSIRLPGRRLTCQEQTVVGVRLQRGLPALARPSKKKPQCAPDLRQRRILESRTICQRPEPLPRHQFSTTHWRCLAQTSVSTWNRPHPEAYLATRLQANAIKLKACGPQRILSDPCYLLNNKSSTKTPRAAVSERSEPPNRTCPSRAATTCVQRIRPEDRPTSAKINAVFCPHTVLRKAHPSLKEVTCIFRLFDYAPTPCTLSIASTFDATNVFAKCSTNDDPSSKP